MGDMREDFDALKEMKREQRSNIEPGRIEYAKKKLFGHEFDCIKTVKIGHDKMEIYLTKDRQIDFWPFTGWFCGRKPLGHIKGRGITNLIKEIKECQSK